MSDNSERNGNGKLAGYVAAAIVTSALATWMTTGTSAKNLAQEAKDHAVAADAHADMVEARTKGQMAVIESRLTAIEAELKKQGDTQEAMWRYMQERRAR